MNTDAIRAYHRTLRAYVRDINEPFWNFMKKNRQVFKLTDTLKIQKIKYDKQQEKIEADENEKMTIAFQDLQTIWSAGAYSMEDPDLEVCLAFFWISIGNNDRAGEKIKTTRIKDIQQKNWNGIDYIKRDPTHISKKIVNSKTKRSYGVTPYIPYAGDNQPYVIIMVRYYSKVSKWISSKKEKKAKSVLIFNKSKIDFVQNIYLAVCEQDQKQRICRR